MARTDLQRLFWRTATSQIAPREDFTSEVLAIAIRHDARPLLRVFRGIRDDQWNPASGRPSLDFGTVEKVAAHTQHPLDPRDGIDSGRLDVVVELQDRNGTSHEVWIEVKIGARLNPHSNDRDQLDVYLDHRRADPARLPYVTIMTLARIAPFDPRVTGICWEDLTASVDAEPDVDRWWRDLVEFLRADGIVPHRLPGEPFDQGEFLPVYIEANQLIREMWANPPRPLHWRGMEQKVLDGARVFTSGPATWGMRPSGDGWEWWAAIGTHGYPGVSVPVETLREVARTGDLPRTWLPTDDQDGKKQQVFEKRRQLVDGEPASEAAAWLAEAIRELFVSGMFKPHFDKVRAKDEAAARRKAERDRRRHRAGTEQNPGS
jgi:hypothetical protein